MEDTRVSVYISGKGIDVVLGSGRLNVKELSLGILRQTPFFFFLLYPVSSDVDIW